MARTAAPTSRPPTNSQPPNSQPPTRDVKTRELRMSPMHEGHMRVTIEGLTPLIQNAISDEELDLVQGKRQKGGSRTADKAERKPYDPQRQIENKFHIIHRVEKTVTQDEVVDEDVDGQRTTQTKQVKVKVLDQAKSTYGIPVAAFAKAIAAAGYLVNEVPHKRTNGAITIKADYGALIELRHPKPPTSRRGWGKVNQSFQIYHQPVISDWSCVLDIRYDQGLISEDSVINCLAHAGVKVGVGNNRKERGGENGCFRVTDVKIYGPQDQAAHHT